MHEKNVIVPQKLINKLRMLLIRLAQSDDDIPEQIHDLIERDRQYCEGFLGIKRDVLNTENTVVVDHDRFLKSCGFLED